MSMDPKVPVLEAPHLAEHLASGEPTVVLFYADWCGFCARYMSTFTDEAPQIDETIVAVNLSSNSNPLWDEHGIRAVPTLIAFKDGKEVARKNAIPGLGLRSGQLPDVASQL